MTGDAAPALYVGKVMHARLMPFRHRFTYRVFSLFLDLDGIPALARRLRLFAHNRFALFSFHDRDHGPRDGGPLRPWIEAALARAGVDAAGGAIRVLCFPRVLGFVFNPLTVYWCHDREGRLRALLYEVKNTFGDQHGYLIPVGDVPGPEVRQSCEKGFYVSPFIAMEATYKFRVAPPGMRLALLIRQSVRDGELLVASLTGRRRGLSDGALLRVFVTHPLMTVKVVAAIHWEALRLVLKGATFHARPRPPVLDVPRR